MKTPSPHLVRIAGTFGLSLVFATAASAIGADPQDPSTQAPSAAVAGTSGLQGSCSAAMASSDSRVLGSVASADAAPAAAQAAPAPPISADATPLPSTSETAPTEAAAVKPAAKKANSTGKPRHSTPAVAKATATPPSVPKAWWPAAEPGKLNLVYAGEASFTRAIVLLFDAPVTDGDKSIEGIQVSRNGRSIAGRWLVAKGNPRMLLFGAEPGTYTVAIDRTLVAQDGRSLPAPASGQVVLR